ncbi:MAG: ketopantoate reductase family protein [Candidatus Latescibacterota bacterium]
MRILVFGAGALGQAVGCLLAADGHTVDLILRERFREAILHEGLAVTGIFGDFRVTPDRIGAHSSIDAVRDRGFDYALVTVKSYDTAAASDALATLADQSFTAVSLQNGCGNLEILLNRFGSNRTLAARVITGFEIGRPGLVGITVTADAIHIGGPASGEIPQSAVRLANAINHSGLPCATTPHIDRDLLAKLLYNSALNPLGAILGVHYGALGDNPHSREIMNRVIGEVFAVIRARGARTHWETPEEYENFFYSQQIPATYHHRSSMLQDLEAGKRTEVEALTGYVSTQGRLHGVPTQVCDTLSDLVRFRERASTR